MLQIERFEKAERSSFIFSYVEGSLVRALREGSWILLEEINLANADVLERL
jgi:midasin